MLAVMHSSPKRLVSLHLCVCLADHGIRCQNRATCPRMCQLTCICICKLCFEGISSSSGSSSARVGGLQLFPSALLPLGCCSCCRLGVVEASCEVGLCCRPSLGIGTGRCLQSISLFRQQPIHSNSTSHLASKQHYVKACSECFVWTAIERHKDTALALQGNKQQPTSNNSEGTCDDHGNESQDDRRDAGCWLHRTPASRSSMHTQTTTNGWNFSPMLLNDNNTQ